MPNTLVCLPCTAQELENALHALCDHRGLWDARIDTMCTDKDGGDATVCLVLGDGGHAVE